MLGRSLRVGLSVLLLAACAGTAPTTTRVAAANGGTIANASLQVVIPPLALAADTDVTLDTAPASDYPALPGARPEVLRILPEGTVLEHAATVTIESSFVGAAANDTVAVSQLANVDGVMRWSPLESTRQSSGDVTVSVTRFAPIGVVVTTPGTGAGSIHGVMRWGTGDPAGMAPVQLFLGTTMVGTTTTDATGAFSFAALAPGSYRLVVMYECNLDEPVSVGAGENVMHDLVICG